MIPRRAAPAVLAFILRNSGLDALGTGRGGF
jgi:hypothetical protein